MWDLPKVGLLLHSLSLPPSDASGSTIVGESVMVYTRVRGTPGFVPSDAVIVTEQVGSVRLSRIRE